MRALSTAATGMAAQQLNVEVISNNIANMNTVGFKRQRAEFQDLLYQDMERAGAQTSDAGTTLSAEDSQRLGLTTDGGVAQLVPPSLLADSPAAWPEGRARTPAPVRISMRR